MSEDNSTTTLDQFFAVHSALHVVFAVLSIIPTAGLCGLHIVALVLVKDKINWKMRVVLVNILVPEFMTSVAGIFYLLGYPLRAYEVGADNTRSSNILCQIFLIFYNIGFFANVFGGPFFAVAVFIFTKYNVAKVKWWIIATFISVTWAIAVGLSLAVPFTGSETPSRNGFCTIQQSVSGVVVFSIGVTLVAFNIVIVFAFSITSYCYIRKNTISDGPNPLKKSFANILIFYAVRAVCILIQLLINTTIFRDQQFNDTSNVSRFVVYYIVVVFTAVTALLTPLGSMIHLKPVRDSLKLIAKKLCPSCKK